LSEEPQKTSRSNNSESLQEAINPVKAMLQEAMGLLDECNFFEDMHDAIDREMRATKPDEVARREYMYVQHGILDTMLDKLRISSGQ